MERPIGDIFDYEGTTLEVIQSEPDECEECYFSCNGCLGRNILITGRCVNLSMNYLMFKKVEMFKFLT